MADEFEGDKKKSHRKKQSGVSAEKKKSKTKENEANLTPRQRNPKAFAIQSAVRAERQFRRKEDLTAKKQHIPLVDKTPDEPPPILIAVVGPPKVGKTTLINNLIKNFTRTNVTTINGPITIVTSKKRRITLIECNNDINSMIDIAKCVDLVLLMSDASFGFEMEIFEFLNICQVHGMPKIMGILTHLDAIKNAKTLKRRKKELKHRFWTEVYDGAKLFYLSGIIHGEYLKNEIKNLGRFISIIKFRPLAWRSAHSYLLADRMEDVTNTEIIRLNPKCDREVILYGYLRGVPMTKENMVHIAGLGDVRISELSSLPDPCPMPTAEKKRSLLEKERLLYAPMSGVGGIVYDKDAVYIELKGSHSHQRKKILNEHDQMVQDLIDKNDTLNETIENAEFKLFSDGDVIRSKDFVDNSVEKLSDGQDSDSIDDNEENETDSDDDIDSGVDDRVADWRNDHEEDINEDDEKSSDEEYSEMNGKDVAIQQSDDESNDDNTLQGNMSWKDNLAQKARDAYLERQADTKNLMKIVYGIFNSQNRQQENDDHQEGNGDEEIGGLFKVVTKKQSTIQMDKETRDADECCLFENYGTEERDWDDESSKQLIRNCFVTGNWKKSEDAEELLRLDDLSDADSEIYGDFEDLETGKKHGGKEKETDEALVDEGDKDKAVETRKRPISRVEERNMNRTELMAKKMKLKAQFDADYDNKDDEGRITGDHEYYEELKAIATRQAELNKQEFSKLDDNVRIQIEGYRAGLYVRLGFKKIPHEFVDSFDSTYPILIGSLNMSEENIGYVNCKVKKHRWYQKILKTADPLIISLGWRRFQTVPIYAKIEDNMKHRYLKYTPNHVTCSMSFWGPITPQNTGFLAVQNVEQNTQEMRRLGFRIAATGCVTEVDKTTQIMKKLKLVGTPWKIYRKSAFIKGMFTTALEVAKFEGAKIKTVSGIRGQIKKANSTPEGSFRATFEDKILLSDIVFCRTWYRVDVPKFYAPITSLLLPLGEKSQWRGMKTVGQLKREKNIRNQANIDSLYTPINRQPKIFRPLIIPSALQQALPYKDKPKYPNRGKSFDSTRVAIIRSPHEQKVAKMMTMIKANFKAKKEREKKEMGHRVEKFKAEKRNEEMRKLKRQKELRKKISRTITKMNAAKEQAEKNGGAPKHRRR